MLQTCYRDALSEANRPETEEDSLNLYPQEQPAGTQSSMSPSSDQNIPDTIDAAAVPDSLEDDAASIEASSDTASSDQNSPQTMHAAAIPHSLEDDAVSIDTSSDTAVSHMAAESSVSSSTPSYAGSNSMAAQTLAGSLQHLAYEQSIAAAATRLAAPRSAAARRAYQAARVSDLAWSDVEEVFDRKWHGGGWPTPPRPATSAEGSSSAALPANTTPRKR